MKKWKIWPCLQHETSFEFIFTASEVTSDRLFLMELRWDHYFAVSLVVNHSGICISLFCAAESVLALLFRPFHAQSTPSLDIHERYHHELISTVRLSPIIPSHKDFTELSFASRGTTESKYISAFFLRSQQPCEYINSLWIRIKCESFLVRSPCAYA